MANVAELLLAGNVALVASQNLPGAHISKFISGQYLKFRWNSSTQSVVDRKDIEQFQSWTLKRLLKAPCFPFFKKTEVEMKLDGEIDISICHQLEP
jgi:hypothetical protein